MKFETYPLGTLCKRVTSGGTPKSTKPEYYGGNIPWLNTKEINFNRIYAAERCISKLGLENSSAKWIIPPAVIVAMYGATAGKVATSLVPLTTNQACCNMEIDAEKADFRFIYYYLKWKYQELASLANGGAQQNLSAQLIKKFPVMLPSLVVQRAIADILWEIDDKIELNQKINENLEQQIFALFQAKYKYPSGGVCWKTGCVGDVVNLQRGYDLPKNQIVDGIYPVAGSTDTIAYHTTFTSEPPCIIMGRSGNIGRPRLYLQKCWAHNTTLFSKEFKNSNPYWVYAMLRSIDYRQFQGGSAVPTLNRNHVHAFPIDIPSKEKQDEFGKFAFTLFQTIRNNIEENNKLHKFRDTLLPRLMTGEIAL